MFVLHIIMGVMPQGMTSTWKILDSEYVPCKYRKLIVYPARPGISCVTKCDANTGSWQIYLILLASVAATSWRYDHHRQRISCHIALPTSSYLPKQLIAHCFLQSLHSRKTRSQLRINGERGFLRVNTLLELSYGFPVIFSSFTRYLAKQENNTGNVWFLFEVDAFCLWLAELLFTCLIGITRSGGC